MALAITYDQSSNNPERITRNRGRLSGTIAFDSSYPAGGESVTGTGSTGITGYFPGGLETFNIEPAGGYTFTWDKTNSKIKAYGPAPAIVYEEQQTVASNAITLDYPAAYIMAISSASATIKPVSTSAALGATTNCTFTPTADTRTTITLGTSVSGTVYVTYITQAWKEVFDNLVTETLSGDSTNKVNYTFSNKAVGIQYITIVGSAATTLNTPMLDSGDAEGSGECLLYVQEAATRIHALNTDSPYQVRTSYIKQPTTGLLATRFVTDETAATVAGASDTYQVVSYPMLMWTTANQCNIIAETNHWFVSRDGTIGNNEAKFMGNLTPAGAGTIATINSADYRTIEVDTANDTAKTDCHYIKGTWDEVPTVPLELKNGSNIANLTAVRFEAIGLLAT